MSVNGNIDSSSEKLQLLQPCVVCCSTTLNLGGGGWRQNGKLTFSLHHELNGPCAGERHGTAPLCWHGRRDGGPAADRPLPPAAAPLCLNSAVRLFRPCRAARRPPRRAASRLPPPRRRGGRAQPVGPYFLLPAFLESFQFGKPAFKRPYLDDLSQLPPSPSLP